jgi:hypothetical protein
MKITHVDLTTAGVAQTILWSALKLTQRLAEVVPANAVIIDAELLLITEFSGGGAASVVLTMGDAAVPDELLTAVNVFTGAGTGLTKKNGAYTLGSFEAAYVPQVTITSDVDVDLLTAGSAEMRITYRASSLTSEI